MLINTEQFEAISERVGFDNACILVQRYQHHRDSLEFASRVQRDLNSLGQPMKVGPMKGTIVPPAAQPHIDFLSRMLAVEEDFMHGRRKREWRD